MKSLKTSILVGAVSAVLTWAMVYSVIHEPTSRQLPEGSLKYVISCPGDDDGLTALLGAAGACVLTFTPTFLALRGRVPKDAFASRPTQIERANEPEG